MISGTVRLRLSGVAKTVIGSRIIISSGLILFCFELEIDSAYLSLSEACITDPVPEDALAELTTWVTSVINKTIDLR